MRTEKHRIRLTHPRDLRNIDTVSEYVTAYKSEYFGSYAPGWKSYQQVLEKEGRRIIEKDIDWGCTPPKKVELILKFMY
jgi:hypothetical protein